LAKINLMATILLQQAVYDQFYACPSDVLKDEISRTSIRLRMHPNQIKNVTYTCRSLTGLLH